MVTQKINRDWQFKQGTLMFLQALGTGFGETVQLPHDYMIESDVTPDAPAGSATGYYTAGAATYTKMLEIPEAWQGENIYLHFDGVMMNASVYVNGSLAAVHHYGYTPFTVDLTDQLYYGGKNRISVVVNPSMQPNSRWYTGAGIYRDVYLSHVHPIHIEPNGIFAYTQSLESDGSMARVMAEITIRNNEAKDHQVRVRAGLYVEADDGQAVVERDTVLLVKAGQTSVARVPMSVEHPQLWSAETPQMYQVRAEVSDMGIFTVALQNAVEECCDTAETAFGIRNIQADAKHGLRINGQCVKLKGACIHHDNGLLGAVSVYDSEYRKLTRLKESGYNAVRLAHNPPSATLLEICDRIGMYVFDEAFDVWGHAKQPGDYSQFFADHWQEDMRAFIIRDRNHPSIIFWSTGNEVEERGGVGNGYAVAEQLAAYVRTLDMTRPVTNGLCSMWSGLDDRTTMGNMMKMKQAMETGNVQNLDVSGKNSTDWEDRTESFANCLDVVGYNYMDNHYAYAKERYPERVILGTESYPNQADLVWEQVENNTHVIGDFVWTGYDYIGEAGVGKSAFFAEDAPELKMGQYALSSHTSTYPWRLANDADFTISGQIRPQGVFRRILWGSKETGLYVQNPANGGLTEIVSSWGWHEMSANWNWSGYEGQEVTVYVYSRADEVELWLNGISMGRKPAGKEQRYTAEFTVPYAAGTLEARSLQEHQEVSRATLCTTGEPTAIRLCADEQVLSADGESLSYVTVEIVDEKGMRVPNQEVELHAKINATEENGTKIAWIAGAGSDNPVTRDNYVSGNFTTYQGYGTIVIRSGYGVGTAELMVCAEGFADAILTIHVA